MDELNIREIAKELNCAPSTVSRVLSGRFNGSVKISEKTKSRILDYCRSRNYIPSIHAMRFFSKRSRVIGFLNDTGMSCDHNLSASLFTICSELFAADYRCLPLQNDAKFIKDREYLKIFERQEIDALIIWGVNEHYSYLDELARRNFPFLLLTNRSGDFPAVYVNQQQPITEMVTHCRKLGATRLAMAAFAEGDSYQQRIAGFLAGAGTCEHRIFYCQQDFDNGFALAPELLRYRPDAIICANDATAVGVEKYLLTHGVRIPQDILLTGGDNIAFSRYCAVPITTFDQQTELCAKLCVKQLLGLLNDGTMLTKQSIDTQVIYRQSTARDTD